jgi:nicotinate-nucleotide pyrophosphorylase (carboxylating)
MQIDDKRLNTLVDLALEEDLEDIGDTTSNSVIPESLNARAVLISREKCIIAGLPVAEKVFSKVNPDLKFTYSVQDGSKVEPGTVIATIEGKAISILTAERTALNFLQRLCGVATTSSHYADAVRGTATVILDTRKTTPGWRNLEKYAVAKGGATNHRIGLYDKIMIKDNHRVLAGLEGAGGISGAVQKAREKYPELEIEVEADTLDEVREASEAGADIILLDNMSNEMMLEAVKINNGRAKLEASGGITLERIPSIAALGGIDFISVGALTHSVKAVDISLDISGV